MSVYLPQTNELGLTDLDTEVWITRTPDGLQPVRVDEMTNRHRAAVLRWIRANALLLDRHQRRLIAHLWKTSVISDAELAERLHVLDSTDPEVWVEDTTLVRRLVHLVGSEPRFPRARRLLPSRLHGEHR